MLRRNLSLLALAFGLAVAVQAAPVVIYSNFPADTEQSWLIGQNPSFTAMQFSAANTGFLTSIRFVGELISGTNQVTVSIATDDDGSPNVPFESIVVDNGYGAGPSTVVASSLLHPQILAGSIYWLILQAPAGSSQVWFYNNTGQQGAYFEDGEFGRISTVGAFELLGDTVPEPGSLLLVSAALLAGVWWSRRRVTP